MPRGASLPPTPELLEPERLTFAGVILVIVALGGAIVLGASRRALTGARA